MCVRERQTKRERERERVKVGETEDQPLMGQRVLHVRDELSFATLCAHVSWWDHTSMCV